MRAHYPLLDPGRPPHRLCACAQADAGHPGLAVYGAGGFLLRFFDPAEWEWLMGIFRRV